MDNITQTKRVLSIDMDFIMSPCIQLYNDMVQGYTNEFDIWKNIEAERKIESFLKYDKDKLIAIFDLFTKAILQVDSKNIMFARNHDFILELLCTQENIDFIYNVINIDHHHDIYYSEMSKREVDNFDFTSLNNWVWYLYKYNRLNEYVWVKNITSQNFVPFNQVDGFVYKTTTNYKNDVSLQEPFDYVFVCCSPEWMPIQFAHFFDIMVMIASNIHNTEFPVFTGRYCEGEKSRPYVFLNK